MTTEYVLMQDVERVLAVLTPENRLVARVMLHTGLRVGDVLALKAADLKPQLWVTEAKTGKRRIIGLPEPLLSALKAVAGPVWVFSHRTDPTRHRTRQAVWHDIKRAARAFRLPANVGSHTMRKVYAVELMARYSDIERVQRALKHDRLHTTLIYAMADKLGKQRRKEGSKRRASIV